MRMVRNFLCTAAALCCAGIAGAQTTVTEWTFNSNPPDANTATGTLTPSTGTGTVAAVGSITGVSPAVFQAGTATDTSSAGDNSALQTSGYPAQGTGSGAAGVRFNTSTAGINNVNISFEQRNSNTASRFWRLEYTTGLANGGVYSITTGSAFTPFNFDLSSIPAVNNDPNFGFRLVQIFDPANNTSYTATNTGSTYGTTGTARFDLVRVVQGAPPQGACCVNGTCTGVSTQAACEAQTDATWGGAGSTCSTFTCPPAQGACCLGTVCNRLTQADCTTISGVWTIGQTCTPNNFCDPSAACCFSATGSCLVRNSTDCGTLGGNYQTGVAACSPSPCPPPPPGACCTGTACAMSADPIACYNSGGLFRGIGSTCTPTICIVPTGTVITTYDFDTNVVGGRNLSFTATPDNSATAGHFTDTFDVFGVVDRTINADFRDDSATQSDTVGILRSTETGHVFGVEDLLNPDNASGMGTATWTFNIAGFTGINVSIDFAAFGNFEQIGSGAGSIADSYNFTASIDGGEPENVFTSNIYEGLLPTYTLESGATNTTTNDPAAINGSMILNRFVTITGRVSGSGNTLTLTFNASNDGGGEVFLFDNIVVRGTAAGGTNGACCSGTTCAVRANTACTGANTRYAGNNTACNATGNSTSPCCKADYNQNGSVTVQDIFDFLAGYFSSNPQADINANGSVTVQDIFDFLAAYFAGCAA